MREVYLGLMPVNGLPGKGEAKFFYKPPSIAPNSEKTNKEKIMRLLFWFQVQSLKLQKVTFYKTSLSYWWGLQYDSMKKIFQEMMFR